MVLHGRQVEAQDAFKGLTASFAVVIAKPRA
jgi:hypothetical protein